MTPVPTRNAASELKAGATLWLPAANASAPPPAGSQSGVRFRTKATWPRPPSTWLLSQSPPENADANQSVRSSSSTFTAASIARRTGPDARWPAMGRGRVVPGELVLAVGEGPLAEAREGPLPRGGAEVVAVLRVRARAAARAPRVARRGLLAVRRVLELPRAPGAVEQAVELLRRRRGQGRGDLVDAAAELAHAAVGPDGSGRAPDVGVGRRPPRVEPRVARRPREQREEKQPRSGRCHAGRGTVGFNHYSEPAS